MKKLTIAPRPAGGTRSASSSAPRPAPRPAPGQTPRSAAGPNARRAAAAAPNPTGLATETGLELMRVSKRMSELGLASRREADEWIERGWVRVNGEVAQLGQKVTAADKITVERGAREQQAEQVTVLINKPIGYVSGQAEDGYEPAYTLVTAERRWAQDGNPREFHPRQLKHLVPAGRLDIDSIGLLVLTQDGRVAKQLIGEDSEIEKEYLVRVVWHSTGGRSPREAFPARELARLNHGLALDGKPLKPARVEWENEDQLRFVLREGKKRQIRRMCELVGLKVVGLKRIRIGRVLLGNLPVGQWRYLAPGEVFA